MATKHKANKPQPDKVSIAIKLLYLALAIEIFQLILNASALSKLASFISVIITNVIILAILALFIFMIGKGKNWARYALLVYSVIFIPMSIYSMFQSPVQLNPFAIVISISTAALQIIALVLLFQKPSADWFKLKKRQSKA